MLKTQARVVAPSYAWEAGYEERDARAVERLEGLGYSVTFGSHVRSTGHLGTAPVAERVQDLHDAYADEAVGLIVTYSGGWSSNELLPLIDWDLVRANPKPLVGYSDITAPLNAIYAMTGQVGYLGPCFGTLGEEDGWRYTLEYFNKAVNGRHPFDLLPNADSWKVLQPGEAEARLIGGNFNTFHLLQGTQFQPDLDSPYILVAEDDDESKSLTPRYFSRRIESILQMPRARENLQGILIGRFLPDSSFPTADLGEIIASKSLDGVPVVAEMDFGHRRPLLTLPIGGTVRIVADANSAIVTVI